MCRWSLLKTGQCAWLRFASIFHSLTLQMAKNLVKVIWCRYVCYRICRRNRSFSSLNCQCTAIKFQVTHWNPLLQYDHDSIFSSASLTLTHLKMLKSKVNIQVLKVDRRLITFSRPLFREIKRFRAAINEHLLLKFWSVYQVTDRKLTNRMAKIYNTI